MKTARVDLAVFALSRRTFRRKEAAAAGWRRIQKPT
jgi:hypothetical protein